MAACIGGDLEILRQLVAETNTTLPAHQAILISLYNSPNNRILTSYRTSLIAFHTMHRAKLAELKILFVYLKTSCPFHSAYMDQVRKPFVDDMNYIDFHYKGSKMLRPVYSFLDGRDMRGDEDLQATMFVDMAIMPLYWNKVVAPMLNETVTHVIDFGPGKTSQRFTQDTLAQAGSSKPVIPVAVPREAKKLAEG
jgi:malonyl CoA-acyl carrier protein transacylase